MYKRDQTGFTLIELIIVMAITSTLVLIAFAGQRSLRARAQFDAAVDKIVATAAQARNEAISGVNIKGSGDGGVDKCSGGAPAGQYVFAGVAWTAADGGSPSPIKMDYYKALPNNESCIFDSETLSLPSTVSVTVGAFPLSEPGGRIAYVRTDTGGVVVCRVQNLTTDIKTMFTDGACSPPSLTQPETFTLNLSDADGHTSTVIVDSSGLAKRNN